MGWVVNVTPWPIYVPGKETRCPLDRRLVGPQATSGGVQKILLHPDSIPDRPDFSKSLYRLQNQISCGHNCYLGHDAVNYGKRVREF